MGLQQSIVLEHPIQLAILTALLGILVVVVKLSNALLG